MACAVVLFVRGCSSYEVDSDELVSDVKSDESDCVSLGESARSDIKSSDMPAFGIGPALTLAFAFAFALPIC